MDVAGDRQTTERREFEARLSELERRLRMVDSTETSSLDDSARLEAKIRVLHEAVNDLAADLLDLHNQMATLVSSTERILAGAAGGGIDITLDRDIGNRGLSFVVRRAVRWAAWATLGAARRMIGSSGGKEDVAPGFEIRLSPAPATRAPLLALVLRVSGNPAERVLPVSLADQTDPDLEVAVWNSDTGAAVIRGGGKSARESQAPDRKALADRLSALHIGEIVGPVPPFLPTLVEICRWTMASEGVPLVVVQAVGGRRPRKLFDVEDVDRWCARGDVGADPVVPAMAKIVGFCGKGVPGLAAGRVVWNTFGGGGGYVLSGPPSSAAVHEIAALEGVVVPLGRDDPRPQVLLVTPLSGGAFALVMWLLRGLENEFRCTVFLVEAARGDEHRIRAMSELAAEVYPVAGFLDPMVWPSLAADLVRTRGFTAVLRVGRGFEFSPSDDVRPHVVDLPLDSSEVAPGARVVLALGRGIAGAATAGGATVIPLASAPAVPADPPDPESTVSIRSAFGIPDDHRLVITICDLAAEHRPEDVAAVAHRLHHRRDIHFLLVGEGDLGGTVSDIARYFGLENFTMAPHTHDLHDLIMAADVVLITAERDPWSVPAAAALALGRHLVATDVDGRQELVDACGGDRHALVAPGDVGGLAAAVEAAVDARPRPRATKKAWKAAGARSDQNLRVVADVLRGDKGGSKGDD